MSEQFILEYIPQRMKQLGYSRWHTRYREFVVPGGNVPIIIPAYNQLFFIIEAGADVTIESDYGVYSESLAAMDSLPELIHQHRGEIIMTNPGGSGQRVKTVQVIIVN